MSQPPTYTASQIATALGMKRQAVQWHLKDIKPAGKKLIRGNESDAWTEAQLPALLLEKLNAAVSQQHCRSIEVLLAMPRDRWQPMLLMERICDADINAATKLRSALLPWLYRQHDKRLTSAEMDAAGAADYRRIFGNEITPRYWRELLTRTIQRDRAFEEWNRLEIYLPEKLKAKELPAATESKSSSENFAELEDYIAICGNPHDPNQTEREGIWTLALEKFASQIRAGVAEKSAARQVRDFLFDRASFLATSRDALLKSFNRKLERYRAGGITALKDGRENNGRCFQFPEADRDLLIHRAVFYYRGDIAPAWRDCLKKGFSQDVVSRYVGRSVKKSHVPASVMDSISPEVDILTVAYRGRRALDSIKGYVTRNYEGISSLQCITGDDFTLNSYFYVPDGHGWFTLTRGQVILFIDFRTLRILGWALEPNKSYSSLTIRSLCTHVFSEFGVPQVLYFERGIWKTATLLKGKTDPFTFADISQGLREFGIEFKHAIRPRTKAVERVGGMFQDIAEAEPGYCGRDERRDAPESLRRQMAEVAARKVHPSKYFYSLDQWNHRLGELVAQYNSEPQQGHMLDGLSPDDAFKKHISPCPPTQYSAEMRYLLAHDKRLARVTLNGVTLQYGKNKFNYRGSEIAHLVGREVLGWFDPENPETIVVTNPDRANPICVGRSQNPNALESLIAPESGILKQELDRIEAQASHMKTRYNVVKAKFPLPQRRMLAAAPARDLGREITAQKSERAEAETRQKRHRRQALKLVQRTGVVVPELDDSKLNAAREFSEWMEQQEAKLNGGNP